MGSQFRATIILPHRHEEVVDVTTLWKDNRDGSQKMPDRAETCRIEG